MKIEIKHERFAWNVEWNFSLNSILPRRRHTSYILICFQLVCSSFACAMCMYWCFCSFVVSSMWSLRISLSFYWHHDGHRQCHSQPTHKIKCLLIPSCPQQHTGLNVDWWRTVNRIDSILVLACVWLWILSPIFNPSQKWLTEKKSFVRFISHWVTQNDEL